MSSLISYRSRRGASTELSHDPLAPQASLPPTAASEIVKAARAYLEEPTRPVTPAESSRHLLQSICSYSKRPQTSKNFIGSHEFAVAAASDGMCWGGGSPGDQADIWIADDQPCSAIDATNCPAPLPLRGSGSRVSSHAAAAARRTTVSAPALQPLPSVCRPNSSSRARAASAGGGAGSRLSGLGALAPLRPGTAATVTDTVTSMRLQDITSAEPAAAGIMQKPAGVFSISPAPSDADTYEACEEGTVYGKLAAREASSSTDSSSGMRPSSCGSSSRGSSSCGSCSRLSSRGSERPLQPDSCSLDAAEAELAQMVLDADAAAGDAPSPQQQQVVDATMASRQWLQGVLTALQHIQGLSVSPADAPQLLQHCTQLQCLLDTAADWGCLQQWLNMPSAHPVLSCGMSGSRRGDQLQPVARTTPSSCGGSSSSSGGVAGSSVISSMRGLHAATDLQSSLLQGLVRLVDSKKPDVLVKVGAMLLGITPHSSHLLLPAVKMLYSLSKDCTNDSRFRHHGVLRPLLRVTAALSTAVEQQQSPVQQQEQHTSTALLYCSGCVKNISADATNQKSLGRLGGVSTMAQVLLDQVSTVQAVSTAMEQQPPQQGQRTSCHPRHEAAAQVAVQATAVLRNLAVVPANAAFFVQQQGAALAALTSLLQPFQHDPEVLLNVSRCLSKLSMYESCRKGLLLPGLQQGCPQRPGSRGTSSTGGGSTLLSNHSQRSSSSSSLGGGLTSQQQQQQQQSSASGQAGPVVHIVRALLRLQATQPQQWATGVRLAFALGQLTTCHAEARPLVAAVPRVLDALPQLVLDLVQYSQQQHQQQHQQRLQGCQQQQQQQQPQQHQLLPGPAEDLVTKLLRVLANLSIDRTIGPALAGRQAAADALVAVLAAYEYEAAEELVLNATAALTNLAYYDTPTNKLLQADADVLLLSLLPLLTSGQEESMCEAARAVGNLARASPALRAALLLLGAPPAPAPHPQEAGNPAATEPPHQHKQQQQQQHQQGLLWQQTMRNQPERGEEEEEEEEEEAVFVCTPEVAASSAQVPQVSAGPYVLQSLVLLLDHGSWEVAAASAGALVNLAALPEAGPALSRVGLAAALIGALDKVHASWCPGGEMGQGEAQLGMVDDTVGEKCEAESGKCGVKSEVCQEEECDRVQAVQLLLQCVGNMVTASAAAVSDAILGAGGPRCAELSCSSEDLAGFCEVVAGLAAGPGGSCVPGCVRVTAQLVRSRLRELWGL